MELNAQNFKVYAENDDMAGYYYNLLMSSLGVSVSKHLMDEYFTVVWANDYFYESTLYTKQEYEAIYQNRCSDYFKQDMKEYAKFANAVTEAIAAGKPGYETICKMPQKGEKYIWIKITGSFSEEKVNGIPVIYVVFSDVSEAVEQKELQKQLEESSKQLQTALDMAEAANREKTDFLSRMSHDIRTPMNAIMGMTDIAYAHLDNKDRIKDCLRKISLSSQHLLGLINDVLDMSKIESGKMTLSNSETELAEVMENIVAIMQPGAKDKRQQFDVRLLNMNHERFYCDSLRLRQVLINILSNASKFTPVEGRVMLEVGELPSEDPDTALIKFTIMDTGIGIRPEFLEHIFDPFTRERDSRVDKTEGSGLGMAITKKIVDLMGGTIVVSSVLGAGSTFEVCLPMQICNAGPAAADLPDMKVIVVDDDSVICEHTVQMLGNLGIRAEWEMDGKEAVRKVAQAHEAGEDYDVVVLDWQMPRQDGLQTAHLMKEKAGQRVKILLMSSYDWSDVEEEAIAAGVDGFMMKPLFSSTLRRGLQKYVLGRSVSDNRYEQRADFAGKRFLLVEDNELNREIAMEFLRTARAEVDCACDGVQGIEKFESQAEGYYSLILMDIQMPVLNGYDAARRIRCMDRDDARTVPILAMTADAFAEDIVEAKKAGMNGHLAKPLDGNTLLREISKYVD